MLLFNHIPFPASILLVCWILFLAATVIAFFRKPTLFPWLLFGSAVCLAAAFAAFSPFLHPWDEQFHALVGKNLSKNPLIPRLIPNEPLHMYGKGIWADADIWLHKQPLFTWQMALSIKLFGANAFAVRLPSVLFHGLLVLSVFRIGSMAADRKTGFIAALLVMHTSFLLGLISGKTGTDHNDFIFLCYITFSFWAWFEWNASSAQKWLYWIGIFAGCAILTKWLVGLLVFAAWGATMLPQLNLKNLWSSIRPLLHAFAVAICIALPWQIYTFLRFPEEARHEMSYNSRHIFQALENHGGNAWYHYEQIDQIYFGQRDFLILFAIALLLFLRSQVVRKDYKIFMLSGIGIIYLFFTIVQTKMPAFTIPVLVLINLVFAVGILEAARLFPWKRIRTTLPVLLTLLFVKALFKPGQTLAKQGLYNDLPENAYREHLLKAHRFMEKKGSDSSRRVVFGVDFSPYAHISWMFFKDEIAYGFIPSPENVWQLQKDGYDVAVIVTEANRLEVQALPPTVEILDF